MPDTLTDKAVAAQAAPNTTPAPASEAPLHPADSPPLTPNEPVDEMEDTLLAPDLPRSTPLTGWWRSPARKIWTPTSTPRPSWTPSLSRDDEEEDDDEALPKTSNRVAPRMPGHMPGVPNRPVMHARLPSKAEVFVEGDHVVYPTHGVGKVERIATEEIAGHKLELIHITFEENRMTLRVPVAKARSAGLRKLATRKMFDEAMAVLKGRARIKRTMWSRRAQEYEAKINSGDPLAIAEVVRDLHRNAGQPDQSFSERQIYEAAMDRLAAELAALDQTDKMTAVNKLGDFLKTL
ncbi:MAG: CarD family transcriptional regulator [Acetobacteraceae bacterium]